MSSSFTDLQQFWECPRRLGFRRLGYKPVAQNEAITCGSFVHEGLRAFFAGGAFDNEYATQAVNQSKEKLMRDIWANVQDREQAVKTGKQTDNAASRAHSLLGRYFNGYAIHYQDPMPELEISHASVVCHLDLVAKLKGELSVVDFKTSKSPDMRWYDFSGQCDVYAHVLAERNHDIVGLIIYDIISEEGLFQHIRRPNFERGRRLFGQIASLESYEVSHLLDKPQYQWSCPRCDYFIPCWLWEQDEKRGAMEYLIESGNYVKKEENER